MLKIQRPAPLYRFAVITTERHLTIICPGLNISSAPMWKKRAIDAFLSLAEDTLVLPNTYNSTNKEGTRIEIEKLHHNGYYDDYYKAIADAINDAIEELVQPSDREEAYKKYKDSLDSIVNQNKLERI